MGDSSGVEAKARTFATCFIERRFATATSMFADDADQALLDSFPDFVKKADMSREEVLDEYWWGLHGQYGEPAGVDEVRVHHDTEAAVTFAFENGTETATLTFDGNGISEFSFSPTYEQPVYAADDAFTEHDVTIDAGDVTLDGLITVPEGDGSVPGVVLVHGAGVDDTDGTAANVKILKDIALGLATEGIATLRYEKRLANHAVADDALTLDTVVTDDAVAAVDRLAAVDAVREDALFVAGHSQGGMCAPRIADRHGGLAGVANLDGSPDSHLPPEHADILRYELEIDGELDEAQAAQVAEDRETLRRIADGTFNDDEMLMGRPGVWHQSLREYDPVATARSLQIPMLAIMTCGAHEETQPELVTFLKYRYKAWRDAELPRGSRVDCYADLDHYFQSITPPATPLSLWFGGNVTEAIIEDLAEWIRESAASDGMTSGSC